MMKIILPFIVFFLAPCLQAQPAIKIFAFEQESLPGTIPVRLNNENGNSTKKAAARKDYLIFLSFNKKENISPELVYIKGNPFKIKLTRIRSTPIELVNNTIPGHPEVTTLVPTTSNRILELKINNNNTWSPKPGVARKLTEKNDMVIAYRWKKETWFIALKKILPLESTANQ
jgi:hypothetical protein